MKTEIQDLLDECIGYLEMDFLEFVDLLHMRLDHPMKRIEDHSYNRMPSCCDIYPETLNINGIDTYQMVDDLEGIENANDLKTYFDKHDLINPRVYLNHILIDEPHEFVDLAEKLSIKG